MFLLSVQAVLVYFWTATDFSTVWYTQSYTTWVGYAVFKYAVNWAFLLQLRKVIAVPSSRAMLCAQPIRLSGPIDQTQSSLNSGCKTSNKAQYNRRQIVTRMSSNRVHRRTKHSVSPPSLYSKLGHGVCCSLEVAVTAAPHCLEGLGWESFNRKMSQRPFKVKCFN